jgi:isoquinoline 1-oxidoreductase beta subunit
MVFASVRMGDGASIAGAAPRGVRFEQGDGWVAAIAADWWSAEQALQAADVRTVGRTGDDAAVDAALDAALREGDAISLHGIGDVETAFEGARPLTADYRAEAALHLDFEPPSATARVTGGLVEVWAGTQAPELARAAAARAADASLGSTILYPLPVGGQGGRALEAELVPVAVTLAGRVGRPVQVTMSRAEQVRTDAVRSPFRARLFARPLPDGNIAGWRMRVAGGDGTAKAMGRLLGGERGTFRKSAFPPLPYAVPNQSIEAVDAGLPLRLGYHRGEMLAPATFFTESFFDELARIGGRDPLSQRMALLGSNPRLARCLVKATGLAGWDGGGPGSQMGLAVLSAYGSHIALVVSAALGTTGEVAVSRMVAVVDCGATVNPALVRQQIEGGLLVGLRQATVAAPSFRQGRVHGPSQPLAPTLRGTPEMLVEILASREASGGVNGLGPAVAPAAVANALAAATGRRLRSLPLDPMS